MSPHRGTGRWRSSGPDSRPTSARPPTSLIPGTPSAGPSLADVFLDLWGVLADSRKMTPAYRQRAAEILWSRPGGSIEGGVRPHDVAPAWAQSHPAGPAAGAPGSS